MPFDDVPRPTNFTNAADASIAKGMLLRGDPQSDIAAWFGLNIGRVNELKKMSTKRARQFRDVPPAPPHALPPPGPYSYFTPRPGMSIAEQIQTAMASQDLKWARALAEIREELRAEAEARRIDANERRQTNEKIDTVLRVQAETRRDLGQLDTKPPTPTRRRPIAS